MRSLWLTCLVVMAGCKSIATHADAPGVCECDGVAIDTTIEGYL